MDDYQQSFSSVIGLFLFGMMLVLPISVLGQSFMTKSGHAKFNSSVPLHSFSGISDHLVGKITLPDSTIDFYVDVNTLETGINKRDRDMLSTLEAEQFPFAEFYGKLVSDFDPTHHNPQKVVAKGEFTIHGVSKQITVDGTLQKTAEGLKVQASWTINMKDYKIKPPGILFYRVNEQIKISIKALLKSNNSR